MISRCVIGRACGRGGVFWREKRKKRKKSPEGQFEFWLIVSRSQKNQTDQLLQEQRQKKEATIYRAPTEETSKAKAGPLTFVRDDSFCCAAL